MTDFVYTVSNEEGLHARPAGLLVKQAQSHQEHSISIKKGDKQADAKRLFSVLGLAVRKGEEIHFLVEGPQAEEVAAELKSFCESHL